MNHIYNLSIRFEKFVRIHKTSDLKCLKALKHEDGEMVEIFLLPTAVTTKY